MSANRIGSVMVPVTAVTRQLSLALFTDAALDLGHKRARAKA